MDKRTSYLWREVSDDNVWRIQTYDPKVIQKLKRRETATICVEGLNVSGMVFRIKYFSPQKAKQSFRRLTGRIIKFDSVEEVFFAETDPIWYKNNGELETNDSQ